MFWDAKPIDWVNYQWTMKSQAPTQDKKSHQRQLNRRVALIKKDITRDIFTEYKAISESYQKANCSPYGDRELELLIKLAIGLSKLDSDKQKLDQLSIHELKQIIGTEECRQLVSVIIELQHTEEFEAMTTEKTISLLINNDFLLTYWLQLAPRSSIQPLFLNSVQLRQRIGKLLVSGIQNSDPSLLEESVLTAFRSGILMDPILRYRLSLRISREVLIEQIEKAYTEASSDILNAIERDMTSYHNWSNSYRWYHMFAQLLMSLKWLFSLGQQTDPQLQQALELDHLRVKRMLASVEHSEVEIGKLKKRVNELAKSTTSDELIENLKTLRSAITQQTINLSKFQQLDKPVSPQASLDPEDLTETDTEVSESVNESKPKQKKAPSKQAPDEQAVKDEQLSSPRKMLKALQRINTALSSKSKSKKNKPKKPKSKHSSKHRSKHGTVAHTRLDSLQTPEHQPASSSKQPDIPSDAVPRLTRSYSKRPKGTVSWIVPTSDIQSSNTSGQAEEHQVTAPLGQGGA